LYQEKMTAPQTGLLRGSTLLPGSAGICKGGTYPLSHLYGHFGLVRLCRLGHDVPWVKA
jgi:hypothetical protein